MNEKDLNKKLLGLMESFPMIAGGGMPEQEDTENVTYSKTKRQGDASVTISANAKSMQELHAVLKLAGITLPADKEIKIDEPEPQDEPCDVCSDEEPKKPTILTMPGYTTDKSVIINALKDKLAKKLS